MGPYIGGYVETVDGKPVGGAEVAAYHPDAGASRTRTDDEGAFLLDELRMQFFRLSAFAEHFNEAVIERVDVNADGVLLVLTPMSSIRGRVVDSVTGRDFAVYEVAYLSTPPGDGAHWQNIVFDSATDWRTFEGGEFVIEDVASGREVAIAARAPGYAANYVVAGPLESGEAAEVSIALEPGAAIEGLVTTPDGYAVSGAEIRLRSDDAPVAARSDDDGRFQLEGLKAGFVIVWAVHEDFVAGNWQGQVRAGPNAADIVLSTGGSIEGVVMTPGGTAVIEHEVGIVYYDRPLNLSKTAQTDANGRYSFKGIREGLYSVHTKPINGGHVVGSIAQEVEAIVETGMVTIVDFEFPETPSALEGTVTARGEPVADATIHVRLEFQGRASHHLGVTDANGRYRIDDVIAGTGQTTYIADGFPVLRIDVEIPAGVGVRQDVELQGSSSVHGRVSNVGLDEHVQVQVLSGDVALQLDDLSELNRQTADSRVTQGEISEAGAFHIDGLSPGTYTLAVIAFDPEAIGLGGARLLSQSVELTDGENLEVNFSF